MKTYFPELNYHNIYEHMITYLKTTMKTYFLELNYFNKYEHIIRHIYILH